MSARGESHRPSELELKKIFFAQLGRRDEVYETFYSADERGIEIPEGIDGIINTAPAFLGIGPARSPADTSLPVFPIGNFGPGAQP